MLTASPDTFPSTTSQTPVWRPARTARPSSGTDAVIVRAHSIARIGPSEGGEEAVAGGIELAAAEDVERPADERVVTLDELAPGPIAELCRSVEPTMSVKRIVASTVSGERLPSRDSTNFSISP